MGVELRGREYAVWWIRQSILPVTRMAESAEIRGRLRKSAVLNDLRRWAFVAGCRCSEAVSS